MEYKIKNDKIELTCSSFGAEIISLKFKGRECIWQNDNSSWTGHAPILFPIAGNIKTIINGVTYPLLPHGFARKMESKFLKMTANSLSFIYEANEETLKLYPFNFNLIIKYIIEDEQVKIIFETKNLSKDEMYYSIGGHTSFALLSDVSNYEVMFNEKEKLNTHIMDRNGKLTGEEVLINDEGVLDLATPFLEDAKTVALFNLKSKRIVLKEKNGDNIASLEFNDFDYLLFWHPKGSHMICMEPWHNHPDYLPDDIEFKDKDGIISLKQNETRILSQTIKYFK